MMRPRRLALATVAVLTVAVLGYTRSRPAVAESVPPLRMGRTTSQADLTQTVDAARRRLAAAPGDATAAVALADALLRLSRVESDAQHALDAERALQQALRHEPGEYTALKMLGAVYLSQHRFRDAVGAATRATAVNAKDAWNFGVIGDASMELGEYERAFTAFDTMARLRPDAAAYGRVAYAHEVQGRLEEALRHMRRAAEATSAHDPESLAWHYAQIGHLHLELGAVDAAEREYARAEYTFPNHPYALNGLARVAAARQDYATALRRYRALLDAAPTPELAATVGDLLAVTGSHDAARAMYARAEALEREGWAAEEPQPAALARMLAERGLKAGDAVALAEKAAATRRDIFTMDALAMSYYRAGRLEEAAGAAREAVRTGSRNRHILYHAAAIAHARGDDAAARRWLANLPAGRAPEPLLAAAVAELSLALGEKIEARNGN